MVLAPPLAATFRMGRGIKTHVPQGDIKSGEIIYTKTRLFRISRAQPVHRSVKKRVQKIIEGCFIPKRYSWHVE